MNVELFVMKSNYRLAEIINTHTHTHIWDNYTLLEVGAGLEWYKLDFHWVGVNCEDR